MSYRLTDGIEFMKSLPDQSVDGIFTDPPWGKKKQAKRAWRHGPDIVGQDVWLELLRQMTDEAARVLRPGGRVLLWFGMRQVADVCRAVHLLEYRWMIFCGFIPARYLAGFESLFDAILIYGRPGDGCPMRPNGKLRQLYQKPSLGTSNTSHPCARPYLVVKTILRDWFDEGEYVIDPFAGSDTTGVACRELNLKYDTCEIDPRMYRTGLARNSQQFLFEDSEKPEKRRIEGGCGE